MQIGEAGVSNDEREDFVRKGEKGFVENTKADMPRLSAWPKLTSLAKRCFQFYRESREAVAFYELRCSKWSLACSRQRTKLLQPSGKAAGIYTVSGKNVVAS